MDEEEVERTLFLSIMLCSLEQPVLGKLWKEWLVQSGIPHFGFLGSLSVASCAVEGNIVGGAIFLEKVSNGATAGVGGTGTSGA